MIPRSIETATSIAAAAYCNRNGYISKLVPFGGKASPATVAGNIEHEYFEHYLKLAKLECTSMTKLISNKLHKQRKNRLYGFVENIIITSHPEFGELCRETLESLDYRIDIFFTNLINNAEDILRTHNYQIVKQLIFPWKIEEPFYNQELGISAKADLIYQTIGNSLVVVDIKSHKSLLPAFMHRDSHYAQMVIYSILAEAKFNLPCNDCKIFYSQDLTYENYTIPDSDKEQVINLRNQMRHYLENPIPPVLSDTEKFKCSFCYNKKSCDELVISMDGHAKL